MKSVFDPYETVVFDLGGVILPLEFASLRAAVSVAFHCRAETFDLGVIHSLHEKFERGEVSAETFREGLRAAFYRGPWGDAPSSEAVDKAWNAILGDFPEAHIAVLRKLRETKRLFLLSNTNEIHSSEFEKKFATRFGGAFFSDLFDGVYYSQCVRMRKPEPRIFRALLSSERLDPARTLFVDDVQENVRVARELGMATQLHPHNGSLLRYFS